PALEADTQASTFASAILVPVGINAGGVVPPGAPRHTSDQDAPMTEERSQVPSTYPDQSRIAEIAANLRALFEPGQVVELRTLCAGPAHSGSFLMDDEGPERLATYALVAEEEGYNCYFGLNPRDPKRCL